MDVNRPPLFKKARALAAREYRKDMGMCPHDGCGNRLGTPGGKEEKTLCGWRRVYTGVGYRRLAVNKRRRYESGCDVAQGLALDLCFQDLAEELAGLAQIYASPS